MEEGRLSRLQMTTVVVLRVLIGLHFLYEGVAKLSKPDWSAAGFLKQARGPLADLFHGMAANPGVLEIVNPLNMWGLTLIGLGLVLGCFTRTAAAAGMLIVLLVISIQPSGVNAFRIGYVVLYRGDGEKLVAHRVIGRRLKNDRIFLRMCGDTAHEHNEWVPAAHVIGRVAAILRRNRVIHLDKGLMRVLSVFWSQCFPAGHLFFHLFCTAKKVMLGFIS